MAKTEAIARLRAELDVMGAHCMRYCEQVRTDDLRALLDAHAEALDALVGALHVLRESDAADVWEEETDAVKAVLAKARRR